MAEIPVNSPELRAAFIKAATWHGQLDPAAAMLNEHPWLADCDIHTAAILGNEAAVRQFLDRDPANATAISEPYGGDALVYLCLSKYLRLDKERSDDLLRTAKALLDAGANPNTGFLTKGHFPEFETAMYGAAGVAQHAALTRLLLDHGADPNDDETPYHSPETYNNDAVLVLLQSGKLNANSLATMLLRKADWHDHDGIKLLLEHGADPNRITQWGCTGLHAALRRDNDIRNIALMLEHGANPAITTLTNQAHQTEGRSAIDIAVWRGRNDALQLFKIRGAQIPATGPLGLIAACAMNDEATIRSIVIHELNIVDGLVSQAGNLFAEFAGNGNVNGIKQLLKLGFDIDALYEGDGYFDIAPASTALHVAAWRANHDTVKFLIEQGAAVNRRDGKGHTPLYHAIRACVDSYWKYRRKPDSVAALLKAGASIDGIAYPTGYEEVDNLLNEFRVN